MSLLVSVQNVCQEIGVPYPATSLIGSTAPGDLQLISIANRSIERIVDAYLWSSLITDYTFSTVIGQDTYTSPSDFGRPINQTQWDLSLRRPLSGPISPQGWQYFKAYGVSGGVYPRFRYKGASLQIDPVPTTVDSVTVSYVSRNGVLVLAGGTSFKFTNDADTTFCSRFLFELELKWRFLRAKGLDYTEELRDAESARLQAWTTDGSKAILDMGDADLNRFPNTIPGNITPPP